MKNNSLFRKVEHWQIITLLMMAYDAFAVSISYFVALWLRFDCSYSKIEPRYFNAWLKFVPVYIIFCITVFFMTKLYRSIWRFASYNELMRVIVSSAVSSVFHTVAITIGYILLLAVAAIYKLEYLIDNAFVIDYPALGKKILGIYIVILAVYFISALLCYSLKYASSRKRLARYFRMLRKLNHIYLVEDGVVKEEDE